VPAIESLFISPHRALTVSKYNITNHRKLHLYNNKMFNQSVT